jgi:hypothetical protein
VKRRIQGLSKTVQPCPEAVPDGVFLVRVDRAQYRWHPAKPFYILRLSVLEPHELAGRVLSGRVYCTAKRCGSSAGSCAIFSTTRTCSGGRKSTRKPFPDSVAW